MSDDIMTGLVNLADKLERLGFYNRANLLDETRSVIKYLQSRNELITRLEKMAFLSPTEMHDDEDYITKDEAKIILRAVELIKELESKEDEIDILFLEARAEAEKAMEKFPQPNYDISKVAEEAGEVVKAAIHCAEDRETPENVITEIKQTIAMLIRLCLEGDQIHGLKPLIPDLENKKIPRHIQFRRAVLRKAMVMDGSDFAGEFDSFDTNTIEGLARTIAILLAEYGLCISDEGYIMALVAGDQGWTNTGLKIE